MSIQFAGSKSGDDRRRRRLVVHTDESILNGDATEEGALGAGVASELVASEAAGPWVPVYEWRIWTYGAMIGLVLLGSAFALARPIAFRPELAPLTGHLLQSPRPVLGVLIQTLFLFLSAQLAILIGWYRSQCRLDFRGRYRVWPWASAAFALAAASSATNAHHLFGVVIARGNLLTWRAEIVAWLLPASLVSLPLVLLLDRDVRRSRSSLFTLRAAWFLGLSSACLELFAADLNGQAWFEPARTIVPMFATAVLFLGLWLHARIVAYICPDPPEVEGVTAAAQLLAGWGWIGACLLRLRRPKLSTETNDEEEAKSTKRGRKKPAEEDDEDAAPKRKRRAPAKRTTRTRTRAKVVEEEVEEEESLDDSNQNSYSEESDDPNGYDESDESDNSSENENEWEEEDATPLPVKRTNPQSSSVPPIRKSAVESRPSNDESAESSEDDEDGDDAVFRRDSGMTAEQMKGLSKRQKRDLRRQLREQQRNQRH